MGLCSLICKMGMIMVCDNEFVKDGLEAPAWKEPPLNSRVRVRLTLQAGSESPHL